MSEDRVMLWAVLLNPLAFAGVCLAAVAIERVVRRRLAAAKRKAARAVYSSSHATAFGSVGEELEERMRRSARWSR